MYRQFRMGEKAMSDSKFKTRWGNTPWQIDFCLAPGPMPADVDFAVVGGGFSGLSAAVWLRKLEPRKTVALFESSLLGAGSSGHTGGMALSETAAGDLPGLGDVLAGFSGIVKELALGLRSFSPRRLGNWTRQKSFENSPISWEDSGNLRAMKLVPGGSIDPGKMVSSLARSADAQGVQIFENAAVENIEFTRTPTVARLRPIRARSKSPAGDKCNVARIERSVKSCRAEVYTGACNGTHHGSPTRGPWD